MPENRPNFPTTRGFRMKMYMKLVFQILINFLQFFTSSSSTTSRDSRFVVDEDDNGKFRLERFKALITFLHHVAYF